MKVQQIFERIEKQKNNAEFLPTGLRAIDVKLDGGLLRKELVVLGAATGVGKSVIAGNIAWNIVRKGFKTGYFSLEISNEMLVSRIMGAETNISPTMLLYGNLLLEDEAKRTDSRGKLLAYSEFIDFFDDIYTLDAILKIIEENKYEFVVIDFIQNIIHQSTDEYTRLSSIALELQKFAKRMNCCIMVLSQLSNKASREGREGVLEYKGSGSIATVADIGFYVTRNELAIEGENKNMFFISIRKNRRGTSGISFPFMFRHPGGEIYEATPTQYVSGNDKSIV